MTALPDQAPAPVLRIVEPVVVRERPSVDAHRKHEIVDARELLQDALDERREPSVEPDHQDRIRCERHLNLLELVGRECERLLDEHRFSRPQCRSREAGVTGVPRGDHDGSNRFVVEDLVRRMRDTLEAEARGDVGCGQPALAGDRGE